MYLKGFPFSYCLTSPFPFLSFPIFGLSYCTSSVLSPSLSFSLFLAGLHVCLLQGCCLCSEGPACRQRLCVSLFFFPFFLFSFSFFFSFFLFSFSFFFSFFLSLFYALDFSSSSSSSPLSLLPSLPNSLW